MWKVIGVVAFVAGLALLITADVAAKSFVSDHEWTVEDVRYVEHIANGTSATLVAATRYDQYGCNGSGVLSFHAVDMYTLPTGNRQPPINRILRHVLRRVDEFHGKSDWRFQLRAINQTRVDGDLILKVGVYGVLYEQNATTTRLIV